jgi:hypothetical protein
MKSYGATEVEPAFDGYGVLLSPAKMASFVKQRATLPDETHAAIEEVCRFIRFKNVGQLERLVTAAWIRTREGLQDTDEVAKRLHQLKPHISVAEAREADREVVVLLEAN